MKFTINSKMLRSAITAAGGAISTRSTIPILSNFLISAAGTTLEIVGTNLNVTIACKFEAKIAKAGSVTVPAKKMIGIIASLPDCEIEIESTESQCLVRLPNSLFEINTLPVEDFPPLPKIGKANKTSMPQSKLKNMLRMTSFSASSDNAGRPKICGVFMEVAKSALNFVSTDGRRLSFDTLELESEILSESTVPTIGISELSRLLENKDSNVGIAFGARHAEFSFVDSDGISKAVTLILIDDNYPNYRQVIPSDHKSFALVDREAFLAALRRVAMMTDEKWLSVRLDFGKAELSMSSKSDSNGRAKESIPIEFKGTPMPISFDPKYLIELFSIMTENTVRIEMTGELSPIVVRGDGKFFQVLMPTRLT